LTLDVWTPNDPNRSRSQAIVARKSARDVVGCTRYLRRGKAASKHGCQFGAYERSAHEIRHPCANECVDANVERSPRKEDGLHRTGGAKRVRQIEGVPDGRHNINTASKRVGSLRTAAMLAGVRPPHPSIPTMCAPLWNAAKKGDKALLLAWKHDSVSGRKSPRYEFIRTPTGQPEHQP
jgi:hypothetical protein